MNIKKFLPHSYPFLLVDTLILFKKHRYILCTNNNDKTKFYYKGHFPGFPLMPGVMILESLAQSCGLLYNISNRYKKTKTNIFLVKICNAYIKKFVRPSERLVLESIFLKK